MRVQATPTGDGRLQVTVTAGLGPIYVVRFGATTNASVNVGAQARSSGNFSFELPTASPSTPFYVQRTAPNTPVTVPLRVEDDRGDWGTFVGGGASAF